MEHFNQGRFEAALDAFDQVLSESTDPTHPTTTLASFYRAEALSRLGGKALAQGLDREAIGYLDAALEAQPGYPDLHFRRAIACLRAGDARGGEQSARRAVDLNPEFVEAKALLMLAHRANGEEQRASIERESLRPLANQRNHPLARAIASDSLGLPDLVTHLFGEEDRRERIRRAEALFHEGLWSEARALLTQLVGENPGFPDLRLRLGAVLFQLGQDDEALEQVESALDTHPGFADARILRGVVALRAGRVGAAIEDLRWGRAAGGPSPFCDFALAVAQTQAGQPALALQLLGPLVSHAAAPMVALRLHALLLGLEQTDEAIARYDQLLRAESSADLVLDAVSVARRSGREDAARRFGSRLPSAQTSALAAVARIEGLGSGPPERLAEAVDAAVSAHPDSPGLRLAAARVAVRIGDRQAARVHLDVLDRFDPPLPGTHALWAAVHELEGHCEESLAALEREQTLPDRDLDLACRKLALLWRTGDADAAQSLWSKLARWAPLDPRVRMHDRAPWLAELVYPGSPASAEAARR